MTDAAADPANVEPEPLVRPPRLNTGRDGNASRLELFFDLAYVLVVLELASAFVADFTGHGLLVITGLFIAVWFSWVGFTLYANRFDTDDVVFRVAKLLATASIAGCAASASDAVGSYAVPFAGCYLAGRLILLGLYLRAWRHVSDARDTIRIYLLAVGVSAAIWAVSLLLPGNLRYLAWAIAVLVDALGPLLVTRGDDRLPLTIEHLPERFGLLVILVLGEAVGGAVRGVHDAGWATSSVLIAAVGFVIAAAMWWSYFDTGGRASAEELEEETEDEQGEPEVDQRHDLFIYGHLPLTFGVVLAGIGIEELALHPDDTLPSKYGWLLALGIVVFLAGVAMLLGGTLRTWRSVWPWPLAAIPAVVIIAVLPLPGGLAQVALFAVLLVGLAVRGTLQQRSDSTLTGS